MTATDTPRFDLELERVRLRAQVAVLLAGQLGDAGRLEATREELARVEEALLPLRNAGGRAEALARRLALGDDALELVWAAVAAATDPRLVASLVLLGGEGGRRGLSLGTFALLAGWDDTRLRALSRALLGPHPLLRHRLLFAATEGQTGPARALQAAPRLCAWLAGDDAVDEELQGAGARVVPPESRLLDDEQRRTGERIAQVLASRALPLLVLEGPSGSGRRTAVAAATAAGRPVIALDARRLPAGSRALESALCGLARECLLSDAVALLADIDPFAGGGDEAGGLLRLAARHLDQLAGPAVLCTSHAGLELPVSRPVVRLSWTVADTATRRALWQRALASGPAAVPDGESALDDRMLAIRYRLGPGGIDRAVTTGRLLAGGEPLATPHLVTGVRSYVAERLGDLAVRIDVRQRWEDLVLAPDLLDQARALVARVRHAHLVLEDWGFGDKLPRGAGVAALFSGPPGTGKTMLAGLLARELDLELYQVDLSKVVSKWVGETEKQLARVFEAADAGHALLLFDEADALFGRRTEVKSATDRYANLEVNYLLQRIESFGGVTVLTTNMDASIDPALRRRLAAHISFWPPDAEERRTLWARMLAARGPVAPGLDLGRLADKYAEMTGANIRNAVLAAAFLAAAEGSAITQALLERAARGEYAAMGRVLRGGKA